ncbi:hypothetical protein BGZ63DRAFT_46511 [Mariannaea sp. PMI_226]|nr:hypothetical protein BGZ63DRAFT_46511 [Mariannaea sp. PMI_226]
MDGILRQPSSWPPLRHPTNVINAGAPTSSLQPRLAHTPPSHAQSPNQMGLTVDRPGRCQLKMVPPVTETGHEISRLAPGPQIAINTLIWAAARVVRSSENIGFAIMASQFYAMLEKHGMVCLRSWPRVP